MNYYYDVLLNFQDIYYMFYEWDELDNIEFIKKIPLVHTESKTICDMISKKIKVNLDFLNQLENKTKLKQNKYLKYACIISDGKNSIAIEFNDNGEIISKSSLTIEDELNINEFIYSVNKINIQYENIADEILNKEIRQETKIKKILKLEINDMYKNKNFSKLKYIYLEWFNELLDSIDLMYKNMLNKLNKELTDKEYYIYELLKISYNNV